MPDAQPSVPWTDADTPVSGSAAASARLSWNPWLTVFLPFTAIGLLAFSDYATAGAPLSNSGRASIRSAPSTSGTDFRRYSRGSAGLRRGRRFDVAEAQHLHFDAGCAIRDEELVEVVEFDLVGARRHDVEHTLHPARQQERGAGQLGEVAVVEAFGFIVVIQSAGLGGVIR